MGCTHSVPVATSHVVDKKSNANKSVSGNATIRTRTGSSSSSNSSSQQQPSFVSIETTTKIVQQQNSPTTTTPTTIGAALSYDASETGIEQVVNNDEDEDPYFEVTTELDDASIHSMMMESPRHKARLRQQGPDNYYDFDTFLRRVVMLDEMSTDDDWHSKIPNMDENENGEIEISRKDDPAIPCTILTIPKKRRKQMVDLLPGETAESTITTATTATGEAVVVPYHQLLINHQEQQKKLMSLMTVLLPWTHAIVTRKQRHIQLRQHYTTSILWFTMLFYWPRYMNGATFMKSTGGRGTGTIPSRNPSSLFRR